MQTVVRILLLTLPVWLLTGCSESSPPPADALLEAASRGELQQTRNLLDSGVDPDTTDNCRFTPLMRAAQAGNTPVAELLLASGAQIDLEDKGGYTALMQAAANGHGTLLRRLIEAGAELDHQEQTRGWSALIWAASLGRSDSVMILLAAGADASIRDHQGRTARDWALLNRHPGTAALLPSAPPPSQPGFVDPGHAAQ